MKKLFAAFGLLIFLTACDDGDIEVASFDFADSSVKTCQVGIPNNFFLYATKDKRALILKVQESSFDNQLTTPQQFLTINATNQAIYREYVGNVSDGNICGFPTNVSLGLEKEWNGVGGVIKIETSISKTENTTDGSSRYDSYNHRISLINPSFDNGVGGEQKMDLINFGTYSKPNENNLNSSFGTINTNCNASRTYFFKTNARQSLELTVDNTIFDITLLDTPKIRFINGTSNKFIFKVFNGNVPPAYFCATAVPPTPTIAETWFAQNGNLTNGIVEVVTTTIVGSSPQQYKHQITLKNLTLKNGVLFFNLGNSYDFGSFSQ